MTDKENYYELLNIPRDVACDRIPKVRAAWSRIYHPDSNVAPDEERLKRINNACDILEDPERRKEYDETLEREKQKSERGDQTTPFGGRPRHHAGTRRTGAAQATGAPPPPPQWTSTPAAQAPWRRVSSLLHWWKWQRYGWLLSRAQRPQEGARLNPGEMLQVFVMGIVAWFLWCVAAYVTVLGVYALAGLGSPEKTYAGRVILIGLYVVPLPVMAVVRIASVLEKR
jgi:hypothetical protein